MNFIYGLPRAVLVVLGLVAGLLVILALNPPYSVCDAQLETLKKQHTPFLYKDASKKYAVTTGYEKSLRTCREINSSGGCLELFEGIKDAVKDLEASSKECFSELVGESSFNKPLWGTADLLVTLAWGEKPPTDSFERLGWLSEYHLSLLCRIKKLMVRAGENAKWDAFREEKLRTLPGAAEIGRDNAWKMSILSTNCDRLN